MDNKKVLKYIILILLLIIVALLAVQCNRYKNKLINDGIVDKDGVIIKDPGTPDKIDVTLPESREDREKEIEVIAMEYIEAIMDRDTETIKKLAGHGDNQLISVEEFEEYLNKNEYDTEVTRGINEYWMYLTRNSTKGADFEFNYDSGGSIYSWYGKVNWKDGWFIELEDLPLVTWELRLPIGTKASINGKSLSEYIKEQEEYDRKEYDIYRIPRVFKGTKKIDLETADGIITVIGDTSRKTLDTIPVDTNTKDTAIKYYRDAVTKMYVNIMDENKYNDIYILFSEDDVEVQTIYNILMELADNQNTVYYTVSNVDLLESKKLQSGDIALKVKHTLLDEHGESKSFTNVISLREQGGSYIITSVGTNFLGDRLDE